MKYSKKSLQIFVLLLVIVCVFLIRYSQVDRYFNLDFLKENYTNLTLYYNENTYKTLLIFFFAYILTTALSIPGAVILTLAAGGLFGFIKGLILVSFASTAGATLSFLFSRFLFKDYIQVKFSKYLEVINEGMNKDGVFYLLTLRLIPIFPFFIINLVMGVVPIKVLTFIWVSQLGMLMGTMVYINAGLQISKIKSVSDIMGPQLLFSFLLLGMLPFLSKKLITSIKKWS